MINGGFDKLLAVTDSRYRLSVIVAKRSAQLETGFPNLLSQDEYPDNRDGESHYEVTIAIQELVLDRGLTWGESLPSDADLLRTFEADRADSLALYPRTPTPEKPSPVLEGQGLGRAGRNVR